MAIYRVPVTITHANLPSPAVNVWHIRVETAGDIPDVGVDPTTGPLDAIRDFYANVGTLFAANTTVTMPTTLVEVTNQSEQSAASFTDLVAGQGSPTEQGLAICVSWKTSLAARRGHGRTFVGPLSANVMGTDGKPVAVHVQTVRTAAAALVSASTAVNGWAVGVWGQEAAGVASAKVLRDITGATVNAKFAHLRSRRD